MKLLTIAASLFSTLVMSADLKVGDPAPKATLTLENGTHTDLETHYKKGLVVVYFYPKADTPGCTAQACSLRDAYADLTKQGIEVFGVSADTVESQKAFKEKYKLPFSLVSDPKGDVAKAFGVKMLGNLMSRQAFLIKDGKIIWLDRTASTKDQAKDILAVFSVS